MPKLKPFDPVDPERLSVPGNESERVIARIHAKNMLAIIDHNLKVLRAERRAWNKRLGVCLRRHR